jgi:hypothetical protein
LLKTYRGSCHCGAVKFEADIDLSQGTNKCNCSICTKSRNWNAIIKPAAFRLLAGEHELSSITSRVTIYFAGAAACARSQEDMSSRSAATTLPELAALDDASAAELIAAPVRYADGRGDDWASVPAETRHL